MLRKLSSRSGRRRFGAAALALVVAGAIAWCSGLVWFARQVPRRVDDPGVPTDAIVVLTGGAGRLSTGLDLLSRHLGRKLFISGVYRGVEVAEILSVWRQAPESLDCCIELGHTAVDTAGNARETAQWMAKEGFRSLRLVTANYHMPRSLAEFRRAMPGVVLTAHPVFPEHVRIDAWWRWPGTAALLASEFTKFLLAMARPEESVAR
ncbi:MAG: YdcF family protein [Alphaproteobacteria bacterium]